MSGASVISARALRKDYGKGTGLTHAVAGIDGVRPVACPARTG